MKMVPRERRNLSETQKRPIFIFFLLLHGLVVCKISVTTSTEQKVTLKKKGKKMQNKTKFSTTICKT